MAIAILGNGGVAADVDGTTFRALRTVARPVGYGPFGAFQGSLASGTMAVTLVVNAEVFAFRWSNSMYYAKVTYFKLQFQTLAAFTAGMTNFGFDAFFGRAMTGQPSGGHTPASISPPNLKTRTAVSQPYAGYIGISNGAATGLVYSSGQAIVDAFPFAQSVGRPQRTNPAAGTEEVRVNDCTLEYKPDIASGEEPIILSFNEGIIIRNRVVWPAAGTGVLRGMIRWSEVPEYV